MAKEEAVIIGHYRRDVILGHGAYVYADYEWTGSRHGAAWVDMPTLQRLTQRKIQAEVDLPARLMCFPWPLRLVNQEIDFIRNAARYVREDSPWWWLWPLRFRLAQRWRWLNVRLIYTAVVWGLAHVPEGSVPSWRHLGIKRDDRA